MIHARDMLLICLAVNIALVVYLQKWSKMEQMENFRHLKNGFEY